MKYNVVIPAAGEATRLRPLTNSISKIMVPLNGKPFFDYIIENIEQILGKDNIEQLVVVHGKFDDIQSHVERNRLPFTLVRQENPKGPLDAVSIGVDALTNTDLPLLIWLGDTLASFDLKSDENFLVVSKVEDHSSWCIYDGEFHNKPESNISNGVALVGVYHYASTLVAKDHIVGCSEYDISAALQYTSNWELKEVQTWHDIGDISNYHKTAAHLLSSKSRHFNSIEFNELKNTLTKRSTNNAIKYEIEWYDRLSSDQLNFVPRVRSLKDGYEMSYESGIVLSDLLLHYEVNSATIDYLFNRLFEIMTTYFWHQTSLVTKKDVIYLWLDKTLERINQIPLPTDLRTKVLNTAVKLPHIFRPIEVMHGDFHGGNIIYNPYTNAFKLIDPRGHLKSDPCLSGDMNYELCKFAHDFICGYGEIIANKPYPPSVKKSAEKIIKLFTSPSDYDTIIKGGALLLLTAIPCHGDNKQRQELLLARAKEYF